MLDQSRQHLHSVNETYIRHMAFALGFAARLIGAGLAVLIHALIPALFQTTGSRLIFALNDELRRRMDRPAA